jgi:hypothetical protein
MIPSRRFLVAIAAIAGFISIIFLQFGELSLCYASSKPRSLEVNESGTIVVSGAAGREASSLNGKSSENANNALCNQGICVDLYPKDGRIEGKQISLLNPAGMNVSGQVVGLCVLEQPSEKYPFVREPDGHMWIFKTPSSSGQGEFTDISDSGNAVGFYRNDLSKTETGFLMNSQRQWVMDIKLPSNPCPSTHSFLHTEPNGINDEGEIVGNYDCTENPDDAADAMFKGNGFYRSSDGTFYRVQYENASRTVAGKISNIGVIVGYYVIDNDTWIPFAAKKDEVIKPIAPLQNNSKFEIRN